jgi:two-component system response regulator VanR
LPKLLIVEDERVIRENLKLLFEGESYEVVVASNGEKGIEQFIKERPDLVLMDIMMPKMNGYAATKKIREISARTPVVFLTAKDSDADEIHALSLGAHDFVSKSSECGVLLMRVKRALERTIETSGSASEDIVIGNVRIDATTYLTSPSKVSSERLTKTEFELLKVLNQHSGEYIAIETLIEILRGKGYVCEDAMVYAHIYNLRRKLPKISKLITSSRGRGYCLEKQTEE